MENGKLTLIASTTENPYYCVYNAILSRSSVFEFKNVKAEDCIPSFKKALSILNSDFSDNKTCDDKVLHTIAACAGGDVRMAIGILENAFYVSGNQIFEEILDELLPSVVGHYDRDGDSHYDLLSCLQKSIRGSDPDATVFYLAKILSSGDLLSACRRLLVIASEDIGAAYPLAAVITHSCVESAKALGLPEAAIPLANAAVILATAPKSNTTYTAYALAKADLDAGLGYEITEHLRSPMFRGSIYPRDNEYDYYPQGHLPYDLIGKKYYSFGTNKTEQAAKAYYDYIRGATSKLKQ
jgi:putative ATPase